MIIIKNNQRGIVALLMVVLVLPILFGIVTSISFLIFNQQKIVGNVVKSLQTYYMAEGGIEDALLRLKSDPTMASRSYSFPVGGGTANVEVSDLIGGSRTIISEADFLGRVKKVQVVYSFDSTEASFFYGVQAGDGGVQMGGNARILGSIFSNGSIIGSNGAKVDNDVVVARNGNRVEGLDIGGNALAYSCKNCNISGDLTYVEGGSVSGCDVEGSITTQSEEIEPGTLPISSVKIQEWKDGASDGGIVTNDVTISGTQNLGPIQIGTAAAPKDLIVTGGSNLKITGIIYVTGNIYFNNNAIVNLDSSYGSFSGVVIADGRITVSNNVILDGSGSVGSYIMLVSESSSIDPPAISVNNNAQGAVYYSNSGSVYLANNMVAREVTAYKIIINNNAQVQYESGLASLIFTSGPGASWKVEEWKEIE